VDAEERTDPAVSETHVIFEEVTHGRKGERDVMEAGGLRRLDVKLGLGISGREWPEIQERDPVMLVVVGHERQVRILVDHVAAEHRAVPVAHLLHPVGLEHDVSELAGGHRPILLSPRWRPSPGRCPLRSPHPAVTRVTRAPPMARYSLRVLEMLSAANPGNSISCLASTQARSPLPPHTPAATLVTFFSRKYPHETEHVIIDK